MSKLAVTVGMVLIMLLAPLAGVAGAAPTPAQEQVSTDEQELSVDQQTPFTLQADYESADGATVVDNQDILIDVNFGSANSLERDSIGVFTAGEAVPLTFDEAMANTDEDDDLELFIGQTSSEGTSFDQGELLGLFDTPTESLNENVEFEDSWSLEDSNEVSYTDAETGQYVAVVIGTDAAEDVTLSDGDLVLPSDGGTLHGVETFAVQDGTSSLAGTTTTAPGDDVEVVADTDIVATDVHHAVVLYDGDTFSDQSTVIGVDSTDMDDISVDDLSIETSIEEVYGVTSVDDDFDLFGNAPGERHAAGTTSFEELFALAAGEQDELDDVEFEADGVTLQASATGLVGDSDHQDITVGTPEDWDEGEYQWVHIAVDDDGTQLETNTGTISIQERTSTGSSGGTGGGAPAAPSDDDDAPTDDDDPVEDDDTPTDDDPVDDDDAPTEDDDPVEDDDAPTDDDEPVEDDDTVPGFGVTTALVALLSIALLTIRRMA
ncbi:PGF-CTERM sorting domain-containing protein [Natrialba swarupiae]|uniref:PGF-CTERM sorting domain-containing protein n=1 Tax=Natrialba swarupiae TaxID=2448032 RepID=A0A5D5AI37_9EURY|nr:PGF-CTERM sorting domain-containing protein [Natrialba swarupiae]TYT60487.1 PGF-CTERM sorting domain-containing protein [Natrialba swarupiae]